MKKLFILFLITILFIESAYAVSVSPSKVEIDFKPNLKKTITYKISGYDDIEVPMTCPEWSWYNNDLKDTGGGYKQFTVTISFPAYIEKPGIHRCGFLVKHAVDPKIKQLGARAQVGTVINIFVPYPGKYPEFKIKTQNVNKGEPILFEIAAKNRGNQTINSARATLRMYNLKEELIKTLYTDSKKMEPAKDVVFYSNLETSSMARGQYNLVVDFNYDGEVLTKNASFRVGDFYVGIVNYTKTFEINKINKFEVEIESEWNDPIKGVYADINIKYLNKSLVSEPLKTPSADLKAWQKTKLLAYWDTNKVLIDSYLVEIILHYADKTTNGIGKVQVVKPAKKSFEFPLKTLASWPALIVILAIIIIVVDIIWLKRYKKRKK